MAANIESFILKDAVQHTKVLSASFKNKLMFIGMNYSSLKAFKNTSIDVFNNLKNLENEPAFKRLTTKETEVILNIQNDIDENLSLRKNFIKILVRQFITKQINMLENLTVEGLNANPLLCTALKLDTVNDFVRYYAYQAISRSIVTSMGFLVQDLLLFSNENIYEGKNYEEGEKTKWDLVLIDDMHSVKSFFEIKSGFNDLDAAQVKHYAREIKLVEEKGDYGFIGITYGKKDAKTVSQGLLKTYLNDWEVKTLVGKELWHTLSQDPDYHIVLTDTIYQTSEAVLGNASIISKIEDTISRLAGDINSEYRNINDFYNSLW